MPPGKKVLLFTSKNFDVVSLRKALRAHANVTEVGTLGFGPPSEQGGV